MFLSEATKGLKGQLISEGEFSCLAFATEAEQTNFLTFLEKEKFLSALDNPNISCVLTTPELKDKIPSHIRGIFCCDKPKTALFDIHNALAADEAYVGASFETKVGENCNISPLAYIDPKNVEIGDNVTIEPFVVIKGWVKIGNNVIIRSGSVIGAKGFSFSKDQNDNNVPVTDCARIVVEDNVEIFEQCGITTGIFPWEVTLIGAGTKIDGQGFVAHGSHIGKDCMLAGGCKCCGNVKLGDGVWVGPGAVVSNRVEVGDGARVSLGAVVTKNVPAGQTVSGNFAIDHARFMQNLKDSVK